MFIFYCRLIRFEMGSAVGRVSWRGSVLEELRKVLAPHGWRCPCLLKELQDNSADLGTFDGD
jgi:hypothetical protein